MLGSFRDPGGILTPNPQSRNLMRYTVAPRSLIARDVACPPERSKGGRHGALLLVMLPVRRNGVNEDATEP
ncbi:MAG: hypothetical protein RLZZ382_805 [Bacteroidota bacterium]